MATLTFNGEDSWTVCTMHTQHMQLSFPCHHFQELSDLVDFVTDLSVLRSAILMEMHWNRTGYFVEFKRLSILDDVVLLEKHCRKFGTYHSIRYSRISGFGEFYCINNMLEYSRPNSNKTCRLMMTFWTLTSVTLRSTSNLWPWEVRQIGNSFIMSCIVTRWCTMIKIWR
jgi:hypothetical protein